MGRTIGKRIRSLGLVLIMYGSVVLVMHMLLSRTTFYRLQSSDTHVSNACLALLGFLMFLVGHLFADGLWSSKFCHTEKGSRVGRVCKSAERIGVTLLLAGSGGVLSLKSILAYHGGIFQALDHIDDVIGFLFLLMVTVGLFSVSVARILFWSSKSCSSDQMERVTEGNCLVTPGRKKLSLCCAWGALAMLVISPSTKLLVSRPWPLIRVLFWDSSVGFTACSIVAGVCALISLVLATICSIVIVRIARVKRRRTVLSKVGFVIGSILLIQGGLYVLGNLLAVMTSHSSTFRPEGELGALLVGAGVCLLVRSRLPNLRLVHTLWTLLGGAGVGLCLAVSLEGWFTPLDVPLFWVNGFLGVFLPALALLDLGFKDSTTDNQSSAMADRYAPS